METKNILPIPEKFEVTENFGELIIIYKWNRLTGAILLGFSLLWCGMLLYMISQMPKEMIPLTFFHAGVGLFIFYKGLSNILNKTIVTCTNQELTIKAAPLPNFGNKKINSSDIQQLYFTEKISRGKNGTTISYQLHMLDLNNKSKRLIRNLETPEVARFLEQKLEKFYKIKNIEVAGEFR